LRRVASGIDCVERSPRRTGVIEDTSFLTDLLNGNEDTESTLELIERENRPEKVSAITGLEL
jgi:hypothetical protein